MKVYTNWCAHSSYFTHSLQGHQLAFYKLPSSFPSCLWVSGMPDFRKLSAGIKRANFIFAHALPPSSPSGMPRGQSPYTLSERFGKRPYPEHRVLRVGGHGIAHARSGASAPLQFQILPLTCRRAPRAQWLPVHSIALGKRSHLFPLIVLSRSIVCRFCFLPFDYIVNSKKLAPRVGLGCFYSSSCREGVFSATPPLPPPEMPGRVVLNRTNGPGPRISSLLSPLAPLFSSCREGVFSETQFPLLRSSRKLV